MVVWEQGNSEVFPCEGYPKHTVTFLRAISQWGRLHTPEQAHHFLQPTVSVSCVVDHTENPLSVGYVI